MTYRIEFSRKALRQFKHLSTPIQTRLKVKIDALARDPRPPGVKKLEGEDELYRIRVGDHRVIYQVKDQALIVVVVKLGHRSEVYRRQK